ncbi:MAG: choloylglycine hydrolase family protein [Proteobacteria bacterium]|nr:choloylglycine hydrolase family protein [Pseudomonadota bacterium]
MYLQKGLLGLGLSFSLFTIGAAYSCTNITVKAKDGTIMIGRTMEFGPSLQSRLMNSPRQKQFQTARVNGDKTKQWKSQYGYLFADYFGSGLTVDGMNEKGLSFGYLYLPGYTTYPTVAKEQNDNALPYTHFGDWVLGNFASVKEVKEALNQIHIYAEPISMQGNAPVILPAHATISDKTGESIVVEFIDGQMVVSDNKLGILTNSPTFNWQLTNLKNYANLSPYSPAPVIIDEITYSGTGQGSGLVGLPGDPTPPSRFVKVAALQQYSMPVDDAGSALILAQHILNNVDIPLGLVRGDKSNAPDTMDKTQWTVYKDLKNSLLYYRSYTNPTIQSIDLNKIDWNVTKQFALPMEEKPIIPDATEKFLQSTVK